MDQGWKQKWLEALRSTRYAQGHGSLSNSLGYCCLGVLCDVTGFGRWSTPNHFGRREYVIDTDDHAETYLPHAVQLVVGLSYDQQAHLAEMNDRGESFAAIADYIEKSLPSIPTGGEL